MKRTFWLATGFVLGAAAATKVSRTGPGKLAQDTAVKVAGTVTGPIRRRVDAALVEGRAAMRESEVNLRTVFEQRSASAPDARSRVNEGARAPIGG
jgi:hypothetical protein